MSVFIDSFEKYINVSSGTFLAWSRRKQKERKQSWANTSNVRSGGITSFIVSRTKSYVVLIIICCTYAKKISTEQSVTRFFKLNYIIKCQENEIEVKSYYIIEK
jgi:hypothetical protein